MIKRNVNKGDEELKKLFNSMELQKPTADFTISVMERITKEKIMEPVKKPRVLRLLYFLIILPVVALIYYTPSVVAWFSGLEFDFTQINLEPFKILLSDIRESLQIFTSPAIISIFLASIVLLSIFTLVNTKNIINE